ncbi:hypothetical protein FHT44_005085 [Mycolicibacterium sp. BK634]|uniref:hypothetical protein n=1 Tax=Mycolicibacterium sp. BK634 TaxID=2587099 RepID=UPI001612A022|nr:hypothetical protein [Mycolicibacterium sp. BK634]MBB3752573.1 hypothetical protein [Mycolicibacterium sp. BK634]
MTQVIESIDHGQHCYTSLPHVVNNCDDLLALLSTSPYAGKRQIPDSALLQMIDELSTDGVTYYGRSELHVIGPRRGMLFTHDRFLTQDNEPMQMKVSRVTADTVYYQGADGLGRWKMDRATFEQRFCQ